MTPSPLRRHLIEPLPAGSSKAHREWLHDNVLQLLEFLATGGFGSDIDADAARSLAAEAADGLRACIEDDPQQDELPALDTAIERVVHEARSLSNLDIELELCGEWSHAGSESSRALAAATREALANVRKHARATRAWVGCIARHDGIDIMVIDDGCGYNPAGSHSASRADARLRDRVRHCGGHVTITRTAGSGTLVRIVVDELDRSTGGFT